MIAIDTNIVVRLITADDERQLALALDLVSREDAFITLTVLLETEWVLRSRFGYDRKAIHAALINLPALLQIQVEAVADVDWALSRYAIGGEFADYIHIAAARPIGRFVSFEKTLAARAGSDAPAQVEMLR